MNSEDITTEMLVRLKKLRSGHQGHLTSLANKISALLIDTSYIREVKELSQLFDRQWERFEYDSEGEIQGDTYYMNVTVDFTTAEANSTSVPLRNNNLLMLWLSLKDRKNFRAHSATKYANQRVD